jgi:glutamate-1-semialdehyde 2,1-aminomutase/spore coat polysaccharide biosynthesis protein SpsF
MGQKPKVVAIIQARMSATRFPGKVLADIAGRPMLWHVVNRVRRAHAVDQVVVATSSEPADDAIADFCGRNAIECFRGSETDVLDRFYQAAKWCKAHTVVRITADCPLIDPQVVDKVVSTYLETGYDYVTNTLRYTYPDGLDTEVFSFAVLEAAWREANLPADREHVTPYIQRSGRFRLYNVESETDVSARNLRWTVDEPVDLEFVRMIYDRLWSGQQKPFGLSDILQLLDKEPHLMKINPEIIRNEGYYKSLVNEPPMQPKNRVLDRSRELKSRAEKLIPSCTQTFSKGPIQFVQGVAPVFLMRGQGSHVWDVDGNEYIDYPMALGPIILGHNYPAVTEAVMRQMRDGTTFSLPHPLEVEVAELLVEIIPCAEMVRFGKNGSDATSGAVRVSRAYTGREIIACCGYHGWQDWYIGTTTRNRGVPKAVQELTIPFEYNNVESLKRIFAEHPGQVAAVIMEPVSVVKPTDGFLQQVQELTRHEGALLIFDEVVTGFRIALGGAQEYFGVTPDLACFGKAMANGYPLSAIVGRREVMKLFDEIFFSFTFGGEALSLAATAATIKEMQEKNVIGHLWEQGQKLKDGYNVLVREFGMDRYTRCVGLPPHTVITFEDETGAESFVHTSLFQQECLKRGILFNGDQNICYSHSNDDIEYTLRAFRAAMEILSEAMKTGNVLQKLEGESIQPVFRVRETQRR